MFHHALGKAGRKSGAKSLDAGGRAG